MVTGASTADVAHRARRRPQGRARADPPPPRIVASLLRVPHVVVAVNKMDLVGYDPPGPSAASSSRSTTSWTSRR
jgi:sulfate adenylyltransferase subunit 1 (EFTu-like GTPase family)